MSLEKIAEIEEWGAVTGHLTLENQKEIDTIRKSLGYSAHLPVVVKSCIIARVAEIETSIRDLLRLAETNENVPESIIEHYKKEQNELLEYLDQKGELF